MSLYRRYLLCLFVVLRRYTSSFLLGLVDLDIEAELRGDRLHARVGARSLGLREEPGGRGGQHPWGAVEVHHLHARTDARARDCWRWRGERGEKVVQCD